MTKFGIEIHVYMNLTINHQIKLYLLGTTLNNYIFVVILPMKRNIKCHKIMNMHNYQLYCLSYLIALNISTDASKSEACSIGVIR